MSFIRSNQSQSPFIVVKIFVVLSILSLSHTNSVCPSSAYVSASDASSYASSICATAIDSAKYRIQGGASLYCSAGSPYVTSNDPSILAQALCITITTTPGGSSSSTSDIPIKMSLPPGCPKNYIQATYQQALTFQNQICSRIGYWDIVALQGGGSIRGSGYSCAVTQTETAGMGDIACVPLSYIGPVTTAAITIVNADENVCSSCQSLITIAEAGTYYTSIRVGTTARIAGGSSVQRTSTSTFTIIDHDPISRSIQICASIPRAGCPTRSYLTSSCTCEACASSCYTCSGPSFCESCSAITGFPFFYNLFCYNPCPSNTFQSSSATCDDCSSNCFTCSGNADYCTSCNPASSSKYLYNGVCYATCPPGTYEASPSICEDCASPCQTCSSTSTKCTTCLSDFPHFINEYCYQTCPAGSYRDSLTSNCLPCSNDCTTCSETANTCTSCSSLTSTPFLYENKCFAQCPASSFLSSPNICSSCSPGNKCSADFPDRIATLSDLPKITKAFSKTSNIGFTIGAIFSSGPMAVFTGLLFKLIGYIKYLDVAYPNNLEQAFQKWQSDLIPSVFPEMSRNTINKLKSKPIPAVYLERKVAPTFLENFWFSMLNLAISFFSLGCIFLAVVYCKQKGKKNAELILKYLLTGLINFIVVQLYYHCGDILLFFILETRSIDFGSAFSVVSFCISIIFLCIAICTLTLHSFILFRYTNAHQKKKISEFEKKYSLFKILFQPFKGSSFLPSSYLLLFTLRDVALNLIIALLFEHTLAQAILFLCICVAFMSYLIIIRPFKKTMENIGQCVFEALVLLTYIFALLIRCADTSDWNNRDQIKDRLGMGVIVMALIFSVGSTILMVFTIIRMSLHFYKEQAQRKAFKKIHVLPENSQAIQQNLNVTNLIKNSTFHETHDSLRALDGSPVRSARAFENGETVPAHNPMQIELSLTKNLSLAERIQIKRSQNNPSARKAKNRLELFKNNSPVNEQGKLEKLQLDKSVIQEESDQTSRSLSAEKLEKRDSSRLHTHQNQSRLSSRSNHHNSIDLISYHQLPSNAESPENKFSKIDHNFRDSTLTDNRIINFSPDKDEGPTEN